VERKNIWLQVLKNLFIAGQDCILLNKAPKGEVSDTTGDAICTSAGYKKLSPQK